MNLFSYCNVEKPILVLMVSVLVGNLITGNKYGSSNSPE
jgi:hypothetical protein